MKELYGLSPAQMAEVYCAYVYEDCLDEIRTRLYDGTYGEEMRKKGIPELTVDEINEAAKWLQKNILAYTHWTDGGEAAINYVLAKRPSKEEPNPRSVIHLGNSAGTAYYDQVLKMYGLTDGDAFKIKGSSLIYHFDNGDLLYSEKLDDERSELSDYTLGEFLFNFTKEDIELVGKPQPKDFLNDTLKMIGLETMQCFRIDNVEFKDQTLRIDSFGDVYVVITEATDDYYEEDDEVEHDYLTLGRILTQYYDKIIPLEG